MKLCVSHALLDSTKFSRSTKNLCFGTVQCYPACHGEIELLSGASLMRVTICLTRTNRFLKKRSRRCWTRESLNESKVPSEYSNSSFSEPRVTRRDTRQKKMRCGFQVLNPCIKVIKFPFPIGEETIFCTSHINCFVVTHVDIAKAYNQQLTIDKQGCLTS